MTPASNDLEGNCLNPFEQAVPSIEMSPGNRQTGDSNTAESDGRAIGSKRGVNRSGVTEVPQVEPLPLVAARHVVREGTDGERPPARSRSAPVPAEITAVNARANRPVHLTSAHADVKLGFRRPPGCWSSSRLER
ncbi:hypothetical protein UK23_42985 [Lentzea aerocolonigenes]|uniref:Uncharacterized protein n=1 Tax=Lentzea aerocolonigenes TaxID=68170 RepID=A0A0F0GFK7_LENAE|nr:hypothetical protein UK23_42985 [Lentzea aerocolonigenes]